METHEFTQEYFGQTVLHPVGLLAVVVLGLAMLVLPRRYAVIPILLMACFIAPAQRLAIFTLNFDLLRLMVIAGVFRVLARSEWECFRWGVLDTAFLVWSLYSALANILLWFTLESLKLNAGQLYDQIGLYFMFRCLVRGCDDVALVAKAFAVISLPVMLAFAIEHLTSRNLFAFLGGVPEITMLRQGRLRCQGAFAHPILAGCFWAAQLPLIASLWWRQARGYALLGGACSLAIIALCASSTPIVAVALAAGAGSLYLIRNHMRLVRRTLLVVLLGLHLTMNAPVWHLMARIDVVGGSTGWHRANLISEAVKHVDQWWLIGTQSVANWNVYKGDITNQFILEGVRGGLASMLLFVLVIVLAFSATGTIRRQWAARSASNAIMAWALGVSLFVHVSNFLGVSYFGQINMVWYLLLAITGSLASQTSRRATVLQRPEAPRTAVPCLPSLAR